MTRQTIALFGGAAPRPGQRLYELAYDIGYGLTAAGFDLINGGHEGTMEAASRGAREGGTRVTGVTCGLIRDTRGARANPYIHEVIDVPTLFERIEIMLRRAAGYVIMAGGTGTLAELGLVWEHVNKAFITPRPIVCVGSAWKPVIEAVATVQPGADGNITWAGSADEAVRIMVDRAIEVDSRDRAFPSGADEDMRNDHA